MLDTVVHGLIGFFLLGFAWYAIAPISADVFFNFVVTPQGMLVNIILTALLAAVIGGFVVGATSSSVGKALFGIKVLNTREETIGIGQGLLREFKVWLFGLGLGIPIVALVTMSVAYRRLTGRGSTSWDQDRNVVLYRENSTKQKVLNVIGFILVAAVAIAMRAM